MKDTDIKTQWLNDRITNQGQFIAEYQLREIEILNYCGPHLDQMWAASIVGIILGCDFKDAKAAFQKRLEES